MKKITKNRLLITFAALGMIGASSSALAATVTSTATADIVVDISITQVDVLNFGSLAPTGAAGTVTIPADGGARTNADGNVVLLTGGDEGNPGSYTIEGDESATYAVTLPTSPITLSNGTEDMTMDTFTSATGNATTTGTLDVNGVDTLTVGATLNVGLSQAAGAYTGDYTVEVQYN